MDWRSASPPGDGVGDNRSHRAGDAGVQGLKSLSSNSYPGFTEIDMEFALGTDMQRAQLDVISRLNRVSGLPDNIGGPTSTTTAATTPDLLLHPATARRQGEIDDHQALIEARVKPELERIPGVHGRHRGINERQIQIRFDPYRAAELGWRSRCSPAGQRRAGMCRLAPSTSDAGSTSCALPVAMTWRPWGQGGGLA